LQGKQPMSNGKGKSGSSGAGGGPSTKAAAAAGSSGQGSSGQGSSRPSASSARPIGFRTEEVPVQAAPPLAAEAAGATQQTEPQPAAGSTKKEKEKLRKERQRQRKTEEAWEALQGAIELMKEAAGNVGALEEAMQAASRHEARSEPLAALVAEARDLLEQARAAKAAEVAAAAEAAEAAAAVEAVERSQMEEEMAALTLSVQSDARRLQSDRRRLLQMQAQLGVPPAAPAPHPDDAEEDQCVMCFDAPKDHIILPCYHVCVCEACANLLTQMSKPSCPICRTAIQHTNKVFHS
jgi:hypothetical protein